MGLTDTALILTFTLVSEDTLERRYSAMRSRLVHQCLSIRDQNKPHLLSPKFYPNPVPVSLLVSWKTLQLQRRKKLFQFSIPVVFTWSIFAFCLNQQVVCAVIAGLLHFLFLAAFCWMGAEALQTYVKLATTNRSSINMKSIYVLIGYGIPTIIVAISASIRSDVRLISYYLVWLTNECNEPVLVCVIFQLLQKKQAHVWHSVGYRYANLVSVTVTVP